MRRLTVLVVGGGGREHAMVWKLARSPQIGRLYCAPGNPGIAALAECIDVAATDVPALRRAAMAVQADLVVVGPEAPLAAGLGDALRADGVAVLGPSSDGAALEASKSWSKQLMAEGGIPTAAYRSCRTAQEAAAAIDELATSNPGSPVVVKADGLAAGKGVVVAADAHEALVAARGMFDGTLIGAAAGAVVIEEFLQGSELSVLAVTDGVRATILPPAQDHKRAYDGDRGPNTGGMGAFSPVPSCSLETVGLVRDTVIGPLLDALRSRGIEYRGVVYCGLMLTAAGPKVVEFNCRMGDPETQAVLPRVASDLLGIFHAAASGSVGDCIVPATPGAAVCVVAAAAEYPATPVMGHPISGLAEASADDCLVFHSGTRREDGSIVTAGGRVVSVTGLGTDVRDARGAAYRGISAIHWPGMRYRTDIAGPPACAAERASASPV